MLSTVLLLLLSALTVLAAIPLILKLVPRNEFYGVLTERALSRDEIWYDVNRFCGWSMVAAATCTLLALLFWSSNLLRPLWLQVLAFLVPLCIAIASTLVYEQQSARRRKRRRASRASAAAAQRGEGIPSPKRSA